LTQMAQIRNTLFNLHLSAANVALMDKH